MKYFILIITVCFSAAFFSCQDDTQQREAEALQKTKSRDAVLKAISSNWNFNIPAPAPKVQQHTATWSEWQQFVSELEQKPAGPISAYRKKTKALSDKAESLRNNIPSLFDKPQVRSRIGVLITKIRSLYTYINLDVIPDEKVTALISDITKETISLQNQMDEIIRISEIPKELGEEEMLRALDTVRMADPDRQQQQPAKPQSRLLQRKPLNNTQR